MNKVGPAKCPGRISAAVMRHQITCQRDVQPTDARVKKPAWKSGFITVFPGSVQRVVLSWTFV